MKYYALLAVVLFSIPVFGQGNEAYEEEIMRLNKMINIIVEQNDRLKRDNDTLKRKLQEFANPAIKQAPQVIKPSQVEMLKAIESRMVKVEGGSYVMGCADEKDTSCYYWEKPAHKVTISEFYIGKFPVTQKEWEVIMGYNPTFSKQCPDCPVENVSHNDAMKFIEKLNMLSGKNYRLPTEAEWEFAARGGNKSKGYRYAGDNDIKAVAWYHGNSGKGTQPVGKLKPNELGLYDMSGNVWQWCSDWFYGEYYSHSPTENPKGPDGTNDNQRVVRGGSWWYEAPHCRVTNRDRYTTDAKDDDVGFRLVRD
jgi:formylglycine-generating enzyme required for sulfatase activity